MVNVQRLVAGMTMEEMIADLRSDWAVRYGLQIIGEVANRVSPEIRKMYPQISWRKIIDFRNAMAHGYDRLRYDEMWKTIHKSIPREAPLIAAMLEQEKKRRGVQGDEIENQEPTA